MSLNNKIFIFSFILLIFIFISAVSASDNVTDEISLNDDGNSLEVNDAQMIGDIENVTSESSQSIEDAPIKIDSKIESKKVTAYYKEDCQLVSYLRDDNNQPIANKKVSISINSKIYDRISDNQGKVVLKLNLKPGTYAATVKFAGDENYTASAANAVVKVKKATLEITAKNYKTYFESDLFFKAKVINKATKNPVKGVKVAFKVYTDDNKYKIYYATTDSRGIAELRKNFKVGTYKIVTYVKKNKNIKSKKTKASLTIKETSEMGCSSVFVQVSNTEAVTGFRRDSTNARALKIVKCKLNGKAAIKQYKSSSYFFHSMTTADGWMVGNGGADNPTINRAIEKIAGKIIKAGKLKKSYLKKIQRYERSLGIGHFAIKAPNGKYAIVWSSSIVTGKLKPGQYIDVPNAKSKFRHGNWAKFSKDPAKAAIKIAATDSFGINRRDVTAFHWKATTREGKTSSSLKVYAANDNGRLVGRSTGYLKDDIYFKGTFFSKNKLPKTPSSMLLGVHKFGNIDKLIKTQTLVKVTKLTKNLNESKTFKVTVKDKKTNKAIKNLKIKIKIGKKVFTVKTNNKGVAKLNIDSLDAGLYKVIIYSGNIQYYVSAKSTINITAIDTDTGVVNQSTINATG